MALKGPALRRHTDGGAVSKFNGRTLRCGRYEDERAHARFHEAMAAWIRAGRRLTPQVRAIAKGRESLQQFRGPWRC